MKAFVWILSKLGFGGKSLDRILGALSALDTELEKFEADAKAKHLAEEQKIAAAEAARTTIETDLARADRVRSNVKAIIS
jgi:hypothetical protein